MVPPRSHRVSRVRRYFGYCSSVLSFVYGILTLYDQLSHVVRLPISVLNAVLTPKGLLLSV